MTGAEGCFEGAVGRCVCRFGLPTCPGAAFPPSSGGRTRSKVAACRRDERGDGGGRRGGVDGGGFGGL
ncbi:hypothetical protein LX36DRAFT_662875 [Colletotrichum falcatum]|nr:hypothetical protein LX36DRAFT_662875 [Colletotrichum falcatum]